MNSKKAIIVGAFHEIIELVEESGIEIVGLVDNKKIDSYRNYTILLNDKDGSILSTTYVNIPLILTPDSPLIRYKLYNAYLENGFKFIQLIAPNAKISKTALVGIGTIIQTGVNISSDSIIGKFVKLNSFCNVMHDVQVGDFTTIAPNAVVLGNVIIGKLCYVGSNSTILPNIKISDNVTIGAGAVVTHNIMKPGKYVGVPAKQI